MRANNITYIHSCTRAAAWYINTALYIIACIFPPLLLDRYDITYNITYCPNNITCILTYIHIKPVFLLCCFNPLRCPKNITYIDTYTRTAAICINTYWINPATYKYIYIYKYNPLYINTYWRAGVFHRRVVPPQKFSPPYPPPLCRTGNPPSMWRHRRGVWRW